MPLFFRDCILRLCYGRLSELFVTGMRRGKKLFFDFLVILCGCRNDMELWKKRMKTVLRQTKEELFVFFRQLYLSSDRKSNKLYEDDEEWNFDDRYRVIRFFCGL